MTVRAWFTISALVLVALVVAVVLQFTGSIDPPGIVVHANGERINGALDAACWPQRDGKLECARHDNVDPPEQTIPGNGSFRFVLASPAQPKDGTIRIDQAGGGTTVVRSEWKRTLRYDLDPGHYILTAHAGGSGKGKPFVRYVFALRVTHSGS